MQEVAVSKKLAARATYLLSICALVLSVFYPITKAFAVTTSATYGCVIGSSSACPGDSAWQIKQATGTNADGVYWVKINGTATQIYAIMDSSMGGGGWMLAMKGAAAATKYVFTDSAWTTSGSYTGNLDTSDEDAKFKVFDSMTANQILAVWPGTKGNYCNNGTGTSNATCGIGAYNVTSTYGFTWAESLTAGTLTTWSGPSRTVAITGGPTGTVACPSSYPLTLLTLFQTSSRCQINRTLNSTYSASNNTPANYDPIGNYLFSSQVGTKFFGFNYGSAANAGSPSAWHRARWGFGWNNEANDEGSNDAEGGIGIDVGGTPSIASGDYFGCCGGQTNAAGQSNGSTARLAYQMYVRDTGASLTTANPSFTSNSGTAGGASFTLDTSTVSADTITVTDNTNPSRSLTLTQNADGSYYVGGALAGDQINVSVNYVARSGYQGNGTISLNITATTGGTTTAISIGSVNKLNNATITVTISPSSALGTVNFYWNNRIINRCSSRTVTTGTATCTWKPMTQGQGVLTASFTSSDGVYTNSSATPKYVVVGKRTGTR